MIPVTLTVPHQHQHSPHSPQHEQIPTHRSRHPLCRKRSSLLSQHSNQGCRFPNLQRRHHHPQRCSCSASTAPNWNAIASPVARSDSVPNPGCGVAEFRSRASRPRVRSGGTRLPRSAPWTWSEECLGWRSDGHVRTVGVAGAGRRAGRRGTGDSSSRGGIDRRVGERRTWMAMTCRSGGRRSSNSVC